MSRSRIRLLLIWAVLGALAVTIYIGERKRSATIDAPKVKDEKRLLPVPMEELGAVEIMAAGAMHRFERDAAGLWFYHGMHDQTKTEHGHKADPELAKVIDKALTTLGRARYERTLPLAGSDEFGVTRPELFVAVYLPGVMEPAARYAVGITTPDNFGRYVLQVGGTSVVTVAEYQITSLIKLIDEAGIAAKASIKP